MDRIAARIVAVSESARGLMLGLAIASAVGLASAQAYAQASGSPPTPAKPAAPATFAGCVQKAPDTGLVISTPKVCARLTGKFSVEELEGHEVDLKGVLVPRAASVAASIQVDSVTKVGKSCSDVCSLQPPATRGLHPMKNKEIPGSEGGTPGLTAPPHP